MYLTKTYPISVKTYPYIGQNVPTPKLTQGLVKMYPPFGQNVPTFWSKCTLIYKNKYR